MAEVSHLYNIYHLYDVDGGFGDAVCQKRFVGMVEATESEIAEFLKVWDKPRICERPYSDLYEHKVVAELVKIQELSELEPYNPATRDWPDLPEGCGSWSEYDPETKTWKE